MRLYKVINIVRNLLSTNNHKRNIKFMISLRNFFVVPVVKQVEPTFVIILESRSTGDPERIIQIAKEAHRCDGRAFGIGDASHPLVHTALDRSVRAHWSKGHYRYK